MMAAATRTNAWTHVETPRVFAWSTAIALHVLALMMLLIPLGWRHADAPVERTSVRWITDQKVIQPPPPPDPVDVPTKATPPKAVPVIPQTVATPQLPAQHDTAPFALPDPAPAALDPPTTIAPPAAGGTSGQLQYLRAPPPAYPIAAIRAGHQGTVMLRVTVDAEGRPQSVEISTSSGHRSLDLAARQQVLRHWQFRPAMIDGQASGAIGMVPVTFSMP